MRPRHLLPHCCAKCLHEAKPSVSICSTKWRWIIWVQRGNLGAMNFVQKIRNGLHNPMLNSIWHLSVSMISSIHQWNQLHLPPLFQLLILSTFKTVWGPFRPIFATFNPLLNLSNGLVLINSNLLTSSINYNLLRKSTNCFNSLVSEL